MQVSHKPNILVLCSTFPRWNNDTVPLFVKFLCDQLAHKFNVVVIAPHFSGAATKEEMDSILVYRFRYAPFKLEKLAYGGGILENIKNHPATLLTLPFFLVSQLLLIRRLNKKFSFQIIHAHWIIPQGLVAIIYKCFISTNTKVLTTSHGGDLFSFSGGTLDRTRKWLLHKSDAITVVSSAMKSTCVKIGISEEKINVIPMGVDLKSRFVLDTTIKRMPYSIIFVGRLVEKKGVNFLIEAISHLIEEFPLIHLSIVGAGPSRTQLESLTNSLNLKNHVKFLGAIRNDKIPRLLQTSMIGVVPSIEAKSGDQEGLGLTIVEAMGCGCAVVASDLPAIRDVVINKNIGLLAKPGNSVDIAEKIKAILKSGSMFENLSQCGRKHVEEHFDWPTIGNRYSKLIQHTI